MLLEVLGARRLPLRCPAPGAVSRRRGARDHCAWLALSGLLRAPGVRAEPGALLDAAARHHCYELHIGFTHLGWNIWTGNQADLAATARRLAKVLERGPLPLASARPSTETSIAVTTTRRSPDVPDEVTSRRLALLAHEFPDASPGGSSCLPARLPYVNDRYCS